MLQGIRGILKTFRLLVRSDSYSAYVHVLSLQVYKTPWKLNLEEITYAVCISGHQMALQF